jgi:hypothetical protein
LLFPGALTYNGRVEDPPDKGVFNGRAGFVGSRFNNDSARAGSCQMVPDGFSSDQIEDAFKDCPEKSSK